MLHKDDCTFSIKTPVFEGPLELLLDLVERHKLLINDISLASVTNEFLLHVSKIQKDTVYETSHFIVAAATLLLIKSRSLLPVLELTDEEEQSIDELERRLSIYQIYRDASINIKEKFDLNRSYTRKYLPPKTKIFLPDSYTNIDVLKESLTYLLTNLPKDVPTHNAHLAKVLSLEEMMDDLKRRVDIEIKCFFSKLTEAEYERKNIIVCFLAILEMYKCGSVLVTQANRFSDIEIEKEGLSTPKYT